MMPINDMMIDSPSRLARPSRAYLHVTEPGHLTGLADRVRETTFHDVKGSWSSASGLAPPCVEFAPYGRTPGHGRRSDARQGTIDQDPEFISFLEDLTQPIPVQRLTENDLTKGEADRKDEMKVTPLVQFLRDRKAAKGKNTLATTTEARPERMSAAEASKHARTGGEPKASLPPPTTPRSIVPRRAQDAKASNDGGKVRSTEATDGHRKGKSASTSVSKGVVASTDTRGRHTPSPGPPTGPATASAKKRERGPASATARGGGAAAAAAAARILRRDLGLGARQDSAGTSTATRLGPDSVGPTSSDAATTTTTTTMMTRRTTSTPTIHRRDPVRANDSAAVRMETSSSGRTPAPSTDDGASTVVPADHAGPTTDSSSSPSGPTGARPAAVELARPTQAFLKHANPSQGITDTVLRAAMTRFGEVVRAEIDRKKGFAYVDFLAPEALERAIQASPITIADGRVTVLERQDRPSATGGPRGGGGGGGGVGGGGLDRGGRRGRGRGRGAASPSPSSSSSTPRGTGIGGRRGGGGGDAAGSAPPHPRATPSS